MGDPTFPRSSAFILGVPLSIVNSKACFTKAMVEKRLTDDVIKAMAAKGWVTYGDYCFGAVFAPGAPANPESIYKDILKPLLGENEDDEKYKVKPALCRLHFESYLYMMKDMNNRT